MRHTPGPWERVGFGIWSYKEGQYRRVAFAAVDKGRGDGVARIETEEEAVANARLIAASPEGLQLLQTILARFDMEPVDAIFPCSAMREDIRRYIRAATGE